METAGDMHALRNFTYENFLNDRALKSAESVRTQLSRILERLGLQINTTSFNDPMYYTNMRKALTSGLFMHVAHLQRAGNYTTVKDNKVVALHPSSVITHKPEWVLYNDLVLTKKFSLRTCLQIKGEWLIELAPQYYDSDLFQPGETKAAIMAMQAAGVRPGA